MNISATHSPSGRVEELVPRMSSQMTRLLDVLCTCRAINRLPSIVTSVNLDVRLYNPVDYLTRAYRYMHLVYVPMNYVGGVDDEDIYVTQIWGYDDIDFIQSEPINVSELIRELEQHGND